jgi:hypothetical protein
VDETAARAVLLVRAIEISDPAGEVFSRGDRRLATREARDAQGDHGSGSEVFLARRAEFALERLTSKYPGLARFNAFSGRGVTLLALIGGFGLGAASNALGESHRINIIAFPMLSVLAWNLAVYAGLAIEKLRSPTPHTESHPLRHALAALMLKMGAIRHSPSVLVSATKRFIAEWIVLASPLYSLRARRVLHTAAALLAAGAVAGMYVRGIAYEYRAGWESTFLSEGSVRALLAVVLGPAAALTGIELPDERALTALRWSPEQVGENAAPWIHLYAITVAIVVIVPRLMLALAAWRKERSLSRNFPLVLEDAYFRRLVQGGAPETVRVVPCSYQPAEHVVSNLRTAIAATLPQSETEIDTAVAYGEEENYLSALNSATSGLPDHLILLFNVATTPEAENHEFLVAGVQRLIDEQRGARHLIALVDESSYRERFSEERIAERRRAWRELLLPYDHAFVDLSRSMNQDAMLAQLLAPPLAAHA